MEYRWVSGDVSNSPVYETLKAEGTSMDIDELVTATGLPKTDVVAHLTEGLKRGIVKQVAAETLRPAVSPTSRRTEVDDETGMIDLLLGGK